LVGPVVPVSVPAGARIVREGHTVGTFFVIAEGEAELRSCSGVVGRLTVGDCFGEIDAARARAQSVTVVARSPMRLVTIAAASMDRLCEAIPGLRARLEAALVRDPEPSPPAVRNIGADIVSLSARRAAAG
jgi:CRP-like cAMP-binding protein